MIIKSEMQFVFQSGLFLKVGTVAKFCGYGWDGISKICVIEIITKHYTNKSCSHVHVLFKLMQFTTVSWIMKYHYMYLYKTQTISFNLKSLHVMAIII